MVILKPIILLMSDTKVPTIGPTRSINSLSFKLTDESDINLNNIFIWKNNTELVNVPDSVLKMVGYPLDSIELRFDIGI